MTDYRIGLGNTNADELQGVGISPTPPTNNQGLIYNSTTGLWTPSSVIASVTAPEIEATFTAANQIYKGTGAGTGALQDFDTVLNFQFGAAGQLFAGTGVSTGEKLGIGSAGQRLTVGGADPSGLEWSNPVNPALQYNDLLGWTFDGGGAGCSNNNQGPAYVILNRIPLPAAITVTNVLINLTVFGVTITHSFLALYNSAGTIIGQTADQSTAWMGGGALGLYTLPLVGGPYLCAPLGANDFLWAAFYCGTGATRPSFSQSQGSNSIPVAGCTTARLRCAYINQSNTATLGNISPAGLTALAAPYWMAIS
jgi:hypothetical protein